jgi:hypothetical protein
LYDYILIFRTLLDSVTCLDVAPVKTKSNIWNASTRLFKHWGQFQVPGECIKSRNQTDSRLNK